MPSRAPAATHSSSTVVLIILVRERETEQCGPKLIRGCSQQPLGLDARLDGLVEPDEIERHVAHQRQVVGNVTDAPAHSRHRTEHPGTSADDGK